MYYTVRYKGRRIAKLPNDPESPEFFEAYAAAMRLIADDPAPRRIVPNTLSWLINDYKSSTEYRSLAATTRASYAREIDRLSAIDGFALAEIKRRHIRAIWNGLADRPRTQLYFGQVCSLLFNYGISELDLEITNPAAKLRRQDEAESYLPWSDDDKALFEASSPPIECMTAYMIARYTGPRRADNVGLRRSNYTGATITIAGSKTSNQVTVPAHPRLQAYLDRQPPTLTLIADTLGRPVRPDRLTKLLRKHLRAHGLDHLHLHGLRHTVATELAEAGCSSSEIASVTGHKTLQMVEYYTKRARQKTLAGAAILKLRGNENKT
jgi:integrase